MENITIAGRIGRDAEVRTTPQGDKVASWSVAVDYRAGSERATRWYDCSIWGKRGEALAQYLTKGSSVTVGGEFGTREHGGKTYLTVRANAVTLQGGKPEARADNHQAAGGDKYGKPGSDVDGRDGRAEFDDEIPF